MLWVRISIRAKCTTVCDKVCDWPATGRWFSPSVSSTNKTARHYITEILLKVALNTIEQNRTVVHYKYYQILKTKKNRSNMLLEPRAVKNRLVWKEVKKSPHNIMKSSTITYTFPIFIYSFICINVAHSESAVFESSGLSSTQHHNSFIRQRFDIWLWPVKN